ncbi:MAG: Ig-like domain-containing protein [Thermoanaerobaculia bacterium]
MKRLTRAFRGALGLGVLILAACSEGTPVAPAGAVLRVSAYPTRIAKQGTSQITVNAYRSNGNPVNPGTEIRMSSNVGQIEPVVYTNDSGQAIATLRGDGQVGTATVSAFSGAGEAVTIDVAVGQLAASMTLQVTPSSVPEDGGRLDLLALVRDDQSQPLVDAQVNFRSEVGRLDSGGRFVVTNASGEARDRLTVTAADLEVVGTNNFEVTAEVGGSGGHPLPQLPGRHPAGPAGVVHLPAGRARRDVQRHVDRRTHHLALGFRRRHAHLEPAESGAHLRRPGYLRRLLTVRNSIGSDTASNLVQITN